jgi:hypothetical protein
MARNLSLARLAASLTALALASGAPLAASAATAASAEPSPPFTDAATHATTTPAEAPAKFDLELRMAAGLANSTDGDTIPMLDGYAVLRRGPFVVGLAAQEAYAVHSSETDTRLAVAAGLGWADDRFRATALAMAGVAWWDNRSWGTRIGRERVERTAFFGLRGDAEVRMFTLGPMKAYAGLWAACTVDTSHERLSVPTGGDPEYFIKGQSRLMGGLQLGLTF